MHENEGNPTEHHSQEVPELVPEAEEAEFLEADPSMQQQTLSGCWVTDYASKDCMRNWGRRFGYMRCGLKLSMLT